ncbi:cell division trigger factor [Klebsiella pneumoniae subsp. pneumoniae]|nr:cell division trigger factor [Klebsiella pneumoniae subsp. pneumoniae]
MYPEVELQGLDAIEVEKPVVEVTDADVDTMLELCASSRRPGKKKKARLTLKIA